MHRLENIFKAKNVRLDVIFEVARQLDFYFGFLGCDTMWCGREIH
jgi:hypothetical protein